MFTIIWAVWLLAVLHFFCFFLDVFYFWFWFEFDTSFLPRALLNARAQSTLQAPPSQENARMVERMLRDHPRPWKTPAGNGGSGVCCVS